MPVFRMGQSARKITDALVNKFKLHLIFATVYTIDEMDHLHSKVVQC